MTSSNPGIDTGIPRSMPKAKQKTDAFAFVRNLFGSKSPEFKVEQRKADEEILDRTASVNLAIAETLAPIAVATQDPTLIASVLGASREARECAVARKNLTGGGLAGGTSQGQGITVTIRHSGEPVSDDFHDYNPPSSNVVGIPVQAGSSSS